MLPSFSSSPCRRPPHRSLRASSAPPRNAGMSRRLRPSPVAPGTIARNGRNETRSSDRRIFCGDVAVDNSSSSLSPLDGMLRNTSQEVVSTDSSDRLSRQASSVNRARFRVAEEATPWHKSVSLKESAPGDPQSQNGLRQSPPTAGPRPFDPSARPFRSLTVRTRGSYRESHRKSPTSPTSHADLVTAEFPRHAETMPTRLRCSYLRCCGVAGRLDARSSVLRE